jgi:DNA-binding LytR/AlgR family response regulator
VQARWKDIVSISAEGDYSRVRLASGRVFLELKALSVWEAMLPRDTFRRVHRSWILGWNHVERLHKGAGGRWTLDVQNEPKPIPVGRNYQNRVRDQINLRGFH